MKRTPSNWFINQWLPVLLLCLSLGLAPFAPEPHIWGKLKWVSGGAVGMGGADWFDLLMHGAPWLLLIRLVVLEIKDRMGQKQESK